MNQPEPSRTTECAPRRSVQPDCSARREALVAAVKRDIENVARIYPTAFSLYDEPLDRLARRVVATMEAQNEKGQPQPPETGVTETKSV